MYSRCRQMNQKCQLYVQENTFIKISLQTFVSLSYFCHILYPLMFYLEHFISSLNVLVSNEITALWKTNKLYFTGIRWASFTVNKLLPIFTTKNWSYLKTWGKQKNKKTYHIEKTSILCTKNLQKYITLMHHLKIHSDGN